MAWVVTSFKNVSPVGFVSSSAYTARAASLRVNLSSGWKSPSFPAAIYAPSRRSAGPGTASYTASAYTGAVRMSTFVPLAFFQATMAQFSLAINSGAFCTLPPSATSSVVSAPFTRYVTV